MAINEKKSLNRNRFLKRFFKIFKIFKRLKDDDEKSVKNVANFRQVLRRRRSSLAIFVGRRVAWRR
jgi:hypothetical protein